MRDTPRIVTICVGSVLAALGVMLIVAMLAVSPGQMCHDRCVLVRGSAFSASYVLARAMCGWDDPKDYVCTMDWRFDSDARIAPYPHERRE